MSFLSIPFSQGREKQALVAEPSTGKPNEDTSDRTDWFVQAGHADTATPANAEAPPPLEWAESLCAAFGDRYQLGAQLGRGGFGSVFRANDLRLNRAVAIKACLGKTAEPDQLLREARSLAQLRHPNIVAVYDVAVVGRCCFVVSELLPGPSLAKWLDDQRPTPLDAVQIVAAIGDALAHSHTRSIVHRDVKPSNIVFAEGQRPVLVDFGLALTDLDSATERGLVSGTPGFMSPEQAGGRGHRPDGRTDVYGLAATLYAMLCGRAPFRGRSTPDILRQVREDEPQPPRQIRPEIPPELERVCLKGLAKLPGDRFTTASDFADALLRSVVPLPPLPTVATSPQPAPTSPSVVPRPNLATPNKPRTPRTERRPVTLLQCACETGGNEDDPLEQVAAFQAACATTVHAHGGLPLFTSGTTFLACFGYPVAREDSPRQAVRAALAISIHNDGATTVAVGTGPAVVTEKPPDAPVIVGDVVQVTAALALQGQRAGVVITDVTFGLVEGYFECESTAEIHPRNTSPVRVHTVRAERDARNRLEARDPARLTPLVGRQREVELLKERWELTSEGVQNVLLIVADPGLGKSRLVRVLRDFVLPQEGGSVSGVNVADSTRSAHGGAAVIEWYCSPYHEASPFFPVIDYFDRSYRLSREPDINLRLDRLITRLRADGVHDPEDQALLAAMLSVPAGDRLPSITFTPERQWEKTRDALLSWLNARAENSPVLFVVEDLHWIDPSTEALLTQFVERGGEARVLAVFTFRPEYDPPWKGKAVQTQIALNRLTKTQVGELVRAQTGERSVPQEVIDRITERTDGVPLFVEEFTRLLAERGPIDGNSTTIPTTLNDLLLARLDRMASNKEVVQLGAVLGRTFAYDVILAVSPLDEPSLRAELDKLVGAGLLFAKGSPPRCTYTFKHALIQDAAYQSMVKKTRQQFHLAVAEKLETRFPETTATQPELLARHFTEAGQSARAAGYWLMAGERAHARSANREAIQHLTTGLALLATLPASADRDRQELRFQLLLATATTVACGWGYPGLEQIHVRARELCDRIGRDAPTFAVTWGQWAWRVLRAELDTANALLADLETQAAALDDGYRMEACFALECTTLFRGEFERNLAGGRGLALYDPERCKSHARYTGQNAFCTISGHYGWALAICGYADRAVRTFEDAIGLALRTGDKYSEGFARYHLGCVQLHHRLATAALATGREVIALGNESGFASWEALGTLCHGAAMVLNEADVRKGLDLLDAGVRAFKSTGAELSLTSYLAYTCEGYLKLGLADQAAATLDAAFEMVERTNERFHLSNLLRLRGDLLLDRAPGDAESFYQQAIAVARDQGAVSWELRATIRICRLWAKSGRRAEAGPALSTVRDRYPEGGNLPDLVEARELLVELEQTL